MLINFINTHVYDLIYNSDDSKLKKVLINTGINMDKLIALNNSIRDIRQLIKELFSNTVELEKRKALFIKCKENKRRIVAEKLFTLEVFLDLYILIIKVVNGVYIPNEVLLDDENYIVSL